MKYICMSFGWFHEFLSQVRVDSLTAAESKLFEMLDQGAMIVHVYPENDPDNALLIGRHARLTSFLTSDFERSSDLAIPQHKIERFPFDLDPGMFAESPSFDSRRTPAHRQPLRFDS